MDEDLKLYIPLGVKPEAELFTGFGKNSFFNPLWGPGDGRHSGAGLALYRECDNHRYPGPGRYLWLCDDDYQRPEQFVRGRSGAKPDSLFTRTENLRIVTGMNGGLNNVRNHSGLLPLAGGSRPKG